MTSPCTLDCLYYHKLANIQEHTVRLHCATRQMRLRTWRRLARCDARPAACLLVPGSPPSQPHDSCTLQAVHSCASPWFSLHWAACASKATGNETPVAAPTQLRAPQSLCACEHSHAKLLGIPARNSIVEWQNQEAVKIHNTSAPHYKLTNCEWKLYVVDSERVHLLKHWDVMYKKTWAVQPLSIRLTSVWTWCEGSLEHHHTQLRTPGKELKFTPWWRIFLNLKGISNQLLGRCQRSYCYDPIQNRNETSQ